MEIKMKNKSLNEIIIEANKAYRSGNPLMSDEEYDCLLEEIEMAMNSKEFNEFRVTLTEECGDVRHNYVIGSLNKIRYGENELSKWLQKYNISKLFWSDKLDGMSFVGKYINGQLVKLVSRGDGITGQNLINKAKYINIPLELNEDFTGEIRGELTLDGDSHIKLGFKNRRNGVVGIMGRDEIISESLEHVNAYAYQIISSKQEITDQFYKLRCLGFKVPRNDYVKVADDIEEKLKYILSFGTNYDKDGLVISPKTYTNENVFLPELQVAFKVNSEGVPTTIEGITWEVSKNYLLKPVAQITPVDIDGATITNVTCYNYNYVVENGLGVGAEILLVRSGNVIPKIVSVVKKTGNLSVPKICPSCGHKVEIYGVDLQCTYKPCRAANVKRVASFIKEIGIEDVSEDRLNQWDIVTFNDLIHWRPLDLYKSETKFYDELLKKVFSNSKENIMRAFSFEGVGTTNFDKLLDHFETLDNLNGYYKMGRDYCALPAGIGWKTIEKSSSDWERNWIVLNWITSDSRYNYVEKEKEVLTKTSSNDILVGKSFLATGKFSVSQKELESSITDNGGILAPSVTKTLDYLICAENSKGVSSKWLKADKLGVKIITEGEFNSMIGAK